MTGGNPILSNGNALFNDLLGTTLGSYDGNKFIDNQKTSFGSGSRDGFFTGKPYVEGLGYAFLFRNYRPGLGKWQTQDPLGYPNGLNNFAYCNNRVIIYFDPLGLTDWIKDGDEPYVVGRAGASFLGVDLSAGSPVLSVLEDYAPNMHRTGEIHDALVDYLTNNNFPDLIVNYPTMIPAYTYALTLNLYETGEAAFEFSIDTGAGVFSYLNNQLTSGWNWTTDNINNFFNPTGGTSFFEALQQGWFSSTNGTGVPE
jgi:RHS repeat-associated protein